MKKRVNNVTVSAGQDKDSVASENVHGGVSVFSIITATCRRS
jgi:hypothetical protein